MNKQKMAFQFRLILMGLITISCVGMSCTSLQQTAVATTDDLYYTPNNRETPSKANTDVARNENRYDNRYNANDEEQGEYQDYQSYPDDRYLRLKVSNRNRWDLIDDFGYWNDPRFNYAFYPSYGGWNNWYNGFYGSSWFNPFGINMGMGWGGYSPYMNSFNNFGWGFNDFGYGGFGGLGWGGGWGYGGLGYGGFGYGGFGYGGWNPYNAGLWNPYAGYYDYYGGIGGGFPGRRVHYQDPRATQTSAPTLASYRNPSTSRNFNNTTNVTTGSTRYTGNANLNSNFSNLVKRVVTTNSNVNNANSWDRPARSFNNNYNSNQVNSNSNNNSNRSNFTPSSNSGGRSGGFSSSSAPATGGRAPRQN
jgi:hypothetical protein